MPAYEYTAKDAGGNTVAGSYEEIGDVAMLRAELARVGYTLLKARKKKTARLRTGGRVKQAEVVAFAYKFAGMYSASISITRCLEILAQQTDNPCFKATLNDIKQQVENVSCLKDAFAKHSHIFTDFFIGMLEAGETGGKLTTTLNMAAE